MQHCKLTNLVSEYEFGDLDFSQFRRRHYHSSIQMVKRRHTKVVKTLMEPLYNTGRNVTMDNYFTSATLARHLLT